MGDWYFWRSWIFYYQSGRKQREATFALGHPKGLETYWGKDGQKQWERNDAPDETWTWRVYDAAGQLQAESRWRGKDLVEILR